MEKIFKARRLDNGEWVEFDLDTYSCHRKGCTPYVDKHFAHKMPINKNTICQYTGIKDSEGNRIFEGDEFIDCSFVRMQQGCWVADYGDDIYCLYEVAEDLELSGHNVHDKG